METSSSYDDFSARSLSEGSLASRLSLSLGQQAGLRSGLVLFDDLRLLSVPWVALGAKEVI